MVRLVVSALVLAASAAPAFAQSASTTGPAGSELLQALTACRSISVSTERLACFDRAAGRLLSAEQAGEVVVVDREQARAARRQAFGFSLPSLDIFRGGAAEPELDRVQFTLARANRASDGKWVLTTTEGQVWRQTDTGRLRPEPKRGSKLEVRSAALGSYFMNVDGQRAIRVRREQ